MPITRDIFTRNPTDLDNQFIPTGAWTLNSPTYTGKWRRVGDSMEVDINVTFTDAPDATSFYVNMPIGYVIDIAKLSSGGVGEPALPGSGNILDTGSASYPLKPFFRNTTSVFGFSINSAGTYTVAASTTSTIPFTIGNGDQLNLNFRVPIVGWSTNDLIV